MSLKRRLERLERLERAQAAEIDGLPPNFWAPLPPLDQMDPETRRFWEKMCTRPVMVDPLQEAIQAMETLAANGASAEGTDDKASTIR